MKRVLLLTLALMLALALAACAAPAQPAPTEAPTQAPTEAPAATPDPDAIRFVASYEDGTPVPEIIEAKVGQDHMLKLFFAIENGEGMVGWDRGAFEALGIHSDMSFDFIDDKGLLIMVWSDKAAECKMNFYINGSEDWANPDILYEQEYNFRFTE